MRKPCASYTLSTQLFNEKIAKSLALEVHSFELAC